MLRFQNLVILLVGALALGACELPGTQLSKAEAVTPSGSQLDRDLYAGYLERSQAEYNEGDYRSSDEFALEAMEAARGQDPGPLPVDHWQQPSDKVQELAQARERLVEALDSPAAEEMPAEVAKAQVHFDCWMQEQRVAENFQPEDIAWCRDGLYASLDKLETRNLALAAPAAAVAETEEEVELLKYTVHFDTDKSNLDSEAQAVLREAEAAAAKLPNAQIVLGGNADQAGPSGYNMALSERRATEVMNALVASGVEKSAITTEAFGDTNPVVVSDNPHQRANRRVDIVIGPVAAEEAKFMEIIKAE